MKSILIYIFLAILPVFSNSQNTTSPANAKTIAAQLDKKDKLQQTNNSNNNGRSNKGQCCRNGVPPQVHSSYLILNSTSRWYLWNANSDTDALCPNPISQLGNQSNNWSVDLRNGNGVFLSVKNVQIVNNEMIMSVTGLAKGLYYIEVIQGNNCYRTNFRIGPDPGAIQKIKPLKKTKG